MKVTELTKEQLNHWVARAQGWKLVPAYNHDGEQIGEAWEGEGVYISPASDYDPVGDKTQCFDLIKELNVGVGKLFEGDWSAHRHDLTRGSLTFRQGSDLQELICWVVVVSEYGDYVDV